MKTHPINLEYLAFTAALLLGPNGAMQLAAVYTTIEKVAKRAYEAGEQDGAAEGFERGFNEALTQERQEMDEAADAIIRTYGFTPDPFPNMSVDSVLTLNEDAHGHHDMHYDIYRGRFHRPGENE